jgi:hypothetical protein
MPNITVADDSIAFDTALDYQTQIDLLRDHLLRAQARMKSKADKNRTERQFAVGEQVLLKLQPYAQHSVVNQPCHKLAYKYFGPFDILARIGAVAYKLQLPESAKVHPVFHVSQLKPFTANYTPVFSELPKTPDLAATDTFPAAILQRRMVQAGNVAGVQLLVHWHGLPEEQATWEDYHALRRRYPEAPIWEEVEAQEGASVTPAPTSQVDKESLVQGDCQVGPEMRADPQSSG